MCVTSVLVSPTLYWLLLYVCHLSPSVTHTVLAAPICVSPQSQCHPHCTGCSYMCVTSVLVSPTLYCTGCSYMCVTSVLVSPTLHWLLLYVCHLSPSVTHTAAIGLPLVDLSRFSQQRSSVSDTRSRLRRSL